MGTTIKERDYLWDNIKAVLIFSVLTGHFLGLSTLNTGLSEFVYNWIYSFHMPAFLFVSGFFAKSYCKDSKVRAKKAATLLAYYLVFQIIFGVVKILIKGDFGEFTLFGPSRGLWYFLTMFFLYLFVPIIEKLPWWFVIPLSVVLMIFGAKSEYAFNYLSIMRTFSFAPFFFIGYYMSSDSVKKLRSIKAYIRIPLGLICAASSVLMWHFNNSFKWISLFYGKTNNSSLHMSFSEASLKRLYVMVIAMLMIAALMLMIPGKKTIFSKLGQNSIQIFVFHLPFIIFLFDTNVVHFTINSNLIFAAGLCGTLALTIILSFGCFAYPFRWIQTAVNKLYSIISKS